MKLQEYLEQFRDSVWYELKYYGKQSMWVGTTEHATIEAALNEFSSDTAYVKFCIFTNLLSRDNYIGLKNIITKIKGKNWYMTFTMEPDVICKYQFDEITRHHLKWQYERVKMEATLFNEMINLPTQKIVIPELPDYITQPTTDANFLPIYIMYKASKDGNILNEILNNEVIL